MSISASAQSSLFSIPTTDVVPVKRTYVEVDFISHLSSYKDSGFQSYLVKSVYGVKRGFEIGTNVTFKKAETPNQPVEIQPNFKWQMYSNEGNGVSAAVGGIMFVPVANRTGTDTLGVMYATVSKQVKAEYGPRFTGGYYQAIGQSSTGGDVRGALIGYEQKIHPRVSFIVDWMGGKNRFGYVSPGLAVSLPKGAILTAAYNIGNEGRKNNSLFVTFGKTF